MYQTISLRIRRMRESLHVVDDALLEVFAVGQDAAIPPVHVIPERHVQVQNVDFCVIHGWTAIVPLLVGDAESSTTTPMDVDLVAPPPPPPTARAVGIVPQLRPRRWSSGPLLLVVDSLLTPSTLRADALSSLAIA